MSQYVVPELMSSPVPLLLSPITLTVAKCWDPNPQSCFILPRGESGAVTRVLPGLKSLSTLHLPEGEPVRPIDPAAWVSHTAAMAATLPPPYSKTTAICASSVTHLSSSLQPSLS